MKLSLQHQKTDFYYTCLIIFAIGWSFFLSGCTGKPEYKRYNVLMISIDDMNDFVGFLNGYEGKVHTPNMDQLAAMGTSFRNAHAPSPLCNPSRTAILTGEMPHNTGVYANDQWWTPTLPDVITLPHFFKKSDYKVAGAGKIYHHTAGFNPPYQWDDFQNQVFDDPWQHAKYHPELSPQKSGWYPRNNLTRNNGKPLGSLDWGGFDKGVYDFGDGKAVKYGIDFLKDSHDQPFFLGIGIYHPHLPWYVPQEFIDMYPLDRIKSPNVKENDLEDVPCPGKEIAAYRQEDYFLVRDNGKLAEVIQSYLASISYADVLIGDLLDALKNSVYKNNTIVVLWSDHGWHFGEKNHFHKSTLWERATRVPFIIYHPDMKVTNQVDQPVNLIDLYPTLLDFCGLPEYESLDGVSLKPFFENKNYKKSSPSVTTYMKGNHAVRTERYRFIQYHDGSMELYDHKVDPHEWDNQVDNPDYKHIMDSLKIFVPQNNADDVPRKGAFRFDRETYTWTEK